MQRKSVIKAAVVNVVLVTVLVVVADLLMYWLLPPPYARNFPEYRLTPRPAIPGRGVFLHDYWIRHESRGFDIGANKHALHWVDGQLFEVWSNSIGCFDNEHASYRDYIYLAGDSFAWGYASFPDKFGTLLEQRTGRQVLKCGVTHTGQQHQFEKFLDIVKQVHQYPRSVFVFYSANDIANDYAHPHSTVIDGWQVDRVGLDDENQLVSIPTERLETELRERAARERRDLASAETARSRVLRFLKRYSASAHLVRLTVSAVLRNTGAHETVGGTTSGIRRATKHFYNLPSEKDGQYWFAGNPFAEKNKKALLSFKQSSQEEGFALVVVLIPSKGDAFDDDWYAQLSAFLTDHDIQSIDLTQQFIQRNATPSDVYWQSEGHFNERGNALTATILVEQFPALF